MCWLGHYFLADFKLKCSPTDDCRMEENRGSKPKEIKAARKQNILNEARGGNGLDALSITDKLLIAE